MVDMVIVILSALKGMSVFERTGSVLGFGQRAPESWHVNLQAANDIPPGVSKAADLTHSFALLQVHTHGEGTLKLKLNTAVI